MRSYFLKYKVISLGQDVPEKLDLKKAGRSDLTGLGFLSKGVVKALLNVLQQPTLSWESIGKIKGVGPSVLNDLKITCFIDNPMIIENITFNKDVPLPSDLQRKIIETISWQTVPRSNRKGRSAHIYLDRPLVVTTNEQTYHIGCIKLKGLGLFSSEASTPPSSAIYDESKTYHLSSDKDGNLGIAAGEKKRMGALSSQRARNEYDITRSALEKGIDVNIPLAAGEYLHPLNGEKIGFVVLGIRSDNDDRFGDLINLEKVSITQHGAEVKLNAALYRLMLKSSQKKDGSSFNDIEIVRFFENQFYLLGQNLKRLQDAGFSRFAAHTGNYQIDSHNVSPVFTDLDSVIHESTHPNSNAFFSRCLGLASMLRGLHEMLTLGAGYVVFMTGKTNPYYSLLNGYADKSGVADSLLREVSENLWAQTIEDVAELSGGEHFLESYNNKRVRFDFILLYYLFDPLTRILKENNIVPPYTEEVLLEQLKRLKTNIADWNNKVNTR